VSERPVLIEMGYGCAILSAGWKYIAIRHSVAIEAKAKASGQQPDFLGRINGKNTADLKRWIVGETAPLLTTA
jgi:hypothetical protein